MDYTIKDDKYYDIKIAYELNYGTDIVSKLYNEDDPMKRQRILRSARLKEDKIKPRVRDKIII